MSRLRNDERGMAIATVALLGLAVVMVTSMMILRGTRQVRNTSSDAQWEQALHVAEAGLDYALVVVKIDRDFTTGEIVPTFDDPDAERSWAVTAADARGDGDLGDLPEGQYAIVMPTNEQVVYSVGFAPSRDAIDRRVRVVRASYTRIPGTTRWLADRAFLTNQDLTISGSPVAFEARANVHANGDMTVSGNPTTHDACLSASGLAHVSGNLNDHPACPWPGGQDIVDIPDIDPRQFWKVSEYDLCPGGLVTAGPAHASFGASAGDEPCTGSILEGDAGSSPYLGWEYRGTDPIDGEVWVYVTNVENHGAFYVYQGSVSVPTGPGTQTNPWYLTLAAEAGGECDAHVGGDIDLSGAAVLAPASGAGSMFMVAGRDILWNGNGRLLSPGVIAAVEQVAIFGNPQVEGSYIAAEACDTEGDSLDESVIAGNPKFELAGPIETQWEFIGSEGSVAVVSWDEL